MKPHFPRILGVALVCLGLLEITAATSEEQSTLTKVGDAAPDFTVKTTDGKEFKLSAHKGKPVLLNFFATWCGPCLAELPHVEKEIWQKYKDRGLVVVVVGREHEIPEVAEFKKKHQYSFVMAADRKREAYGKYATQYIPRTYLLNKEGKIVFQSMGFNDADFKKLLAAIEKETAPAK
jgi:peroxiredoxin